MISGSRRPFEVFRIMRSCACIGCTCSSAAAYSTHVALAQRHRQVTTTTKTNRRSLCTQTTKDSSAGGGQGERKKPLPFGLVQGCITPAKLPHLYETQCKTLAGFFEQQPRLETDESSFMIVFPGEGIRTTGSLFSILRSFYRLPMLKVPRLSDRFKLLLYEWTVDPTFTIDGFFEGATTAFQVFCQGLHAQDFDSLCGLVEADVVDHFRKHSSNLTRRQLDCLNLTKPDLLDEPSYGSPMPHPVELISIDGFRKESSVYFDFGLCFRAVYKKEILRNYKLTKNGKVEMPKEYGFAMPRVVYVMLRFRRLFVMNQPMEERKSNSAPWTISRAGVAVLP